MFSWRIKLLVRTASTKYLYQVLVGLDMLQVSLSEGSRSEPEVLVVLKVDAISISALTQFFSQILVQSSSLLVPFSLSIFPMFLIGQTQRSFNIL
jgi:hypothetical protein